MSAAMTKLEAVNEMLLAIGQAPVNTLSVAGIRDVSIASTILDNVSREVQSEGHRFNTSILTLALDESGHLPLPEDFLRVDPTDPLVNGVPVKDVETGLDKLYDQDEETFAWDEGVEVEIVRLLPFESLPQHARRYIVATAKLRFQAATVGSNQLDALIKDELGLAYAAFRRAELLQADNNLFGRPSMIAHNRFRRRSSY